MSQVGQELVCNGAVCRCDKGSAPSPLQVISPHNSYLQGKLVGTTQDKTFVPFGTCALKNNNACVPALLQWQDFFELVEVNSPSRHPLLEKSTIMCSVGGKVSILNTLQVAVPGLPALPRMEAVRTVFLSLCPLLLNETS